MDDSKPVAAFDDVDDPLAEIEKTPEEVYIKVRVMYDGVYFDCFGAQVDGVLRGYFMEDGSPANLPAVYEMIALGNQVYRKN